MDDSANTSTNNETKKFKFVRIDESSTFSSQKGIDNLFKKHKNIKNAYVRILGLQSLHSC